MTNKKRFPFQPRRPGFNIICLEIQKQYPLWSKKKVMEEAARRYVPVRKNHEFKDGRRPGFAKICEDLMHNNPKWSRNKIETEAKRLWHERNPPDGE